MPLLSLEQVQAQEWVFQFGQGSECVFAHWVLGCYVERAIGGIMRKITQILH